MPFFVYTGPTELYYPDHPRPDGRGVTGVPGGPPVEMDEPPADGRWVSAPKPAVKAKKSARPGPAVKEPSDG